MKLAPVPIQQHAEELIAILDVYRKLHPRSVLEIGSLHGGTLYNWMEFARLGATIISVDLPLHAAARNDRHHWQNWADRFGVTLHAWIADSHDPETVENVAEYAPFDFVFVDGDHYLPGVQQDFDNYYPMVRDGGCIAFHDIMAPDSCSHIDVGTWWRKLQASGEYRTEELVRASGVDSAGIGVVWK